MLVVRNSNRITYNIVNWQKLIEQDWKKDNYAYYENKTW